jgi:hypothetical protein
MEHEILCEEWLLKTLETQELWTPDSLEQASRRDKMPFGISTIIWMVWYLVSAYKVEITKDDMIRKVVGDGAPSRFAKPCGPKGP